MQGGTEQKNAVLLLIEKSCTLGGWRYTILEILRRIWSRGGTGRLYVSSVMRFNCQPDTARLAWKGVGACLQGIALVAFIDMGRPSLKSDCTFLWVWVPV